MQSGLVELEEVAIVYFPENRITEMSTRCCSTGTCDRAPKFSDHYLSNSHSCSDLGAFSLLQKYGSPR